MYKTSTGGAINAADDILYLSGHWMKYPLTLDGSANPILEREVVSTINRNDYNLVNSVRDALNNYGFDWKTLDDTIEEVSTTDATDLYFDLEDFVRDN